MVPFLSYLARQLVWWPSRSYILASHCFLDMFCCLNASFQTFLTFLLSLIWLSYSLLIISVFVFLTFVYIFFSKLFLSLQWITSRRSKLRAKSYLTIWWHWEGNTVSSLETWQLSARKISMQAWKKCRSQQPSAQYRWISLLPPDRVVPKLQVQLCVRHDKDGRLMFR